VLPTPAFFYGMEVGDEVAVELEKGKSLVVRLQALGETDEDGSIRVFFELNGQPRVVKVPNRSATATRPAKRKADEANDAHVAAPMPGVIAAVSVREGQEIKSGDALLSMEAMKMETALRATRDGKIKAIHVKVSDAVDAKDLLIELEPV
jgi:pyruvate carboxylase